MEDKKGIQVIHQNLTRVDGYEKVTGKAQFGADIYREGMLYLQSVYTEVVHGNIKSIDSSSAEKVPGVVGVYTAMDIPGELEFGIIVPDQPAIAKNKVYSFGDVIAVVAAESKAVARKAAKLVKAEYEELFVISEPTKEKNTELRRELYPNNVTCTYHSCKGAAKTLIQNCPIYKKADYQTQRIEHAYIEPEVIFTELNGEQLIIRGSMQLPADVQTWVAKALQRPKESVSVQRSTIGGSFGGKVDTVIAMAIRAALVTKLTGKPVMYELTREESFRESHKRHPYKIHCEIGTDNKGKFQAMIGEAILDGGAYMSLTPAIAWKGVVLGFGPYCVDHTYYQATSYMTNQITCGSMRGFGTPQSIYAMENTINEVAYALHMSPYQIRKMNILHDHMLSPVGDPLTDQTVSVGETLDYVAEHMDFDKKWETYSKKQKGRYRYGVGIACTMRGTSGAQSKDKSQAILYFDKQQKLHISLGLVEMGQGLKTAMIQIAAEAFQMSPNNVVYDAPDTTKELETGSTTGSRGTFMGGQAILRAADDLKMKLKHPDKYGVNPQGIGICEMELPSWDFNKGYGIPFHVYTYSAQAAEVRVDILTGETKVLKIVTCHDCGTVVNPLQARGQVEGGIIMSLGQALLEDFQCDVSGIPRTKDYTNYLIPTMTDLPEIEVGFIEHPEMKGPYGAKSIAEPAVELGAACISGAVNMAIGMADPIRELPLTPERILLHLKNRNISCEEKKRQEIL